MALNSRRKRQMVPGVGHKRPARPVEPDSSKDFLWRRAVGWGYPGGFSDSVIFLIPALEAGITRNVAPGNAAIVVRNQSWPAEIVRTATLTAAIRGDLV